MLPFSAGDYREAIKGLMEQRRLFDARATFQDLSQAIRVPKSYVSKVLLGKANFSTDQIYLIAKYFDLSPSKTRYLELLVEYERCGLADRKDVLLAAIKEMQDVHLQTRSNIDATIVDAERKTLEEYYLDPFNCIVHMALLLKRVAKNPIKLAGELGVTEATIDRSIKTLVRLGLVEFSPDGVAVKSDTIHLPKDSLVFKAWNSQTRMLCQNRLAQVDPGRFYSVSITFTAKEADRQKIQAKFLEFLKDVEKLSQQKPDEQVFQLNFDLFPWLSTAH